MKFSIALSAAAIVFAAAMPLAAHAAGFSDPAQDQAENQITAQLNQQQIQDNGGYGVLTYEGITRGQNHYPPQEQIAQPPDADNLSIIE